MPRKSTGDELSEREIADRMERAVRRSLTMKPMHRPPKPKERPASKGRARKGKTKR